MADETSEGRGAVLVQELRGMIAASYIAGDKELAAERRHIAGAIRSAVNEALERAAALAATSPSHVDAAALAAAIRDLKETPAAPV